MTSPRTLNFASERSSSYHGPAALEGVTGTATGSINERDVYLTWIPDNSANTVTFEGVVNPDGYPSGTTTGTNGAPSQAWGSANAVFCDDAPAPVAPPRPQQQPPPQQQQPVEPRRRRRIRTPSRRLSTRSSKLYGQPIG